jgi:hypothetical protein
MVIFLILNKEYTLYSTFGAKEVFEMLSITNKEKEDCNVWVIDFRGYIHYKANLKPDESMDLDLKELMFGVYRMIFKTEHTSFIQEFVKY